MLYSDMFSIFVKITGVLLLVIANGFFVAAEFSLVGVRRSRVDEIANNGSPVARTLQKALNDLDANLAATQLGITISSLALGWIGESVMADLIEPLLGSLPLAWATAHTIAIACAFTAITVLHIVLGELAPKSFALQRTERTALFVVRPLRIFLIIFRPAIRLLNGLGSLVLKVVGLKNTEEGQEHSTEELNILVAESQRAGLIDPAQQEVVTRTFSLGKRRVRDIMTSRPDLSWIDADDEPNVMIAEIRAFHHDQILFCRGSLDEVLGVVRKQDLLTSFLDGGEFNPLGVLISPIAIHEETPILKLLEEFKRSPSKMAIVVDEYGGLQGVVTHTDILEALTGELSDEPHEDPDFIQNQDGSLMIDGLTSVYTVFDRLLIKNLPESISFHTIAGFLLFKLQKIPSVGDKVVWEGWEFEVKQMDVRRVDQISAVKLSSENIEVTQSAQE